MGITFTANEQAMLAAVIQEMKEIPPVDFSKVAKKTGHKYAKNARAVFKKVWDKLKYNGGDGSVPAESHGDEDEESGGAKPKGKIAPKKADKRSSPKSSVGARRSTRLTKKEKESMALTPSKAKAKAKAKVHFKAQTDEGEDGEEECEVDDGVAVAIGEVEDDSTVSDLDSSDTQSLKDDKLEASLLGITVLEFRHMREETDVFKSAQNLEAGSTSDVEV